MLAAIGPSAQGRYIVSGASCYLLDWLRELRAHFPRVWLPWLPAPRWLLWLMAKAGADGVTWDATVATNGKV